MNAVKILCPTDFSAYSQSALETATSLARDRGATLLIAHVQEAPPAYMGGEFWYGFEEPDHRDLERMLKQVKPTDSAVPCQHRLLVGDPAAAIVDLADSEDVELIVIATHGRTGLSRLVLGSVAEAVVRKAKCPVLTVKSNLPSAVKTSA